MVNTSQNAGAQSSFTTQITQKVHVKRYDSLMERALERDNMIRALQRVEKNKGAAGIDGMTTKQLRPHIRENWNQIKQQLLESTYQPQPVRQHEIAKPDGGMRQLGIPTVLDRMIQQALLQVLTPIFEQEFLSQSYGFRPGRGTHQAVKQAQAYMQQGKRYVVDLDLEKFFDRVNHDILMSKLVKRIADERILCLIRRYLQAGIMLNGCCVASEEGTPQGGPLSPLLANVILHDLDAELQKRGLSFVRYADDITIYVVSKRAAERVLKSVTAFVEKRLKLRVNAEKSAAARPWNRKILGFTLGKTFKVDIWLAKKSLKRLKAKVRELTRGNKCQPMEERIEKLNTYLRGWLEYFKIARMKTIIHDLNEWIRRRLRMCLLRQWERQRTKVRMLMSLGMGRAWAFDIALSAKGPWRLSLTKQLHMVLGKAYWENVGLIDLEKKYNELQEVL